MLLEILIVLVLIAVGYLIYLETNRIKQPNENFGQVMNQLGKIEKVIEEKSEGEIERRKEEEGREAKRDQALQDMLRIFSGTQKRGEIGENILKEILSPFIKTGTVVTDLIVDGKTVEFAWNLGDGKYIPIDSKLPEINELYKEFQETKEIKKQKEIKNRIQNIVEKQVKEIKKYLGKNNTFDKGILAVPDPVFELIPEINADFRKTKVAVCGYGLVFFFAYYFDDAYHKMLELGEIGDYSNIINELTGILQDIKEKANTIDRGVTIIDNANREIKESTIKSAKHSSLKKKKIIAIEER